MEKTPYTCEHYVDMLGYCELKDSCFIACNLCSYEGRICDCPDYQTRESKEAHFIMPQPIGYLKHEPTGYSLAVYKPISRFKRLMLRWCFGLKFEKI